MMDLHTMESPFTGTRIITSEHLTERRQHSRSPARAKRRAAMGHPQHFITAPARTAYMLQGGTMVMHPAIAASIARELAATRDRLEREAAQIPPAQPAADEPLTWAKIEALHRSLRTL